MAEADATEVHEAILQMDASDLKVGIFKSTEIQQDKEEHKENVGALIIVSQKVVKHFYNHDLLTKDLRVIAVNNGVTFRCPRVIYDLLKEKGPYKTVSDKLKKTVLYNLED